MKANLRLAALAAWGGLGLACGSSGSGGGEGPPEAGARDVTTEAQASPADGGDGGAAEAEASVPTEASSPVDAGQTLTVSGTVVDFSGQPRVGARVLVVGQNVPFATTDGSGHFTVKGVTAPYSLATNVSATDETTLYVGLTRSDPTLAVYRNDGQSTSAHLTLTVDGNTVDYAFFSTKDPRGAYLDSLDGVLTWYGTASSITGSFASPVVDLVGCSGITRYGALPQTTVSPNQSIGAVNIVTQPVTSRTVTGSVTVPAGLNFRRVSVDVFPVTGGSFGTSGACITDTAHVSFPVPVLSGATTMLIGYADLGDGGFLPNELNRESATTLVLADAGTIQMALPTPPTLVAPQQAARVLWPPTWSWTAGTTAPHVITLHVYDTNALLPSLWITAPGGTSFALPDLSPLGIVTQKDEKMSWYLQENSAYASVDALAAGVPGTATTPGSGSAAPVSGTLTMIAGTLTVGP